MSGKQGKKNTISTEKHKDINAQDDFEGIDDDLNDSLQKNNELFTLKSEINSLKIEKQKLSIQHEQALKAVEQKNKQLTSQNHKLKRQNSNFSNRIMALERQIEQLKQLIDNHKHQFQNNRKTADFHRSVEDGEQNIGASQLINELLQKDKQILQLKATLQRKQSNHSLNSKNFDSGTVSVQKKQEQIKSLKTTIEELKVKQIAYKRQYEEILTGKQELIRKITAQSEESMKKINQSKERVMTEAKKQVQLGLKNQEVLKHQIKKLEQKSQNMESMLNKLGGEYARKQKQLIMHHEQQKQQVSKNMLQKIKKQYKQKEQKIKKNESRIYELENELVLAKQQTSKLKNEANSMNKMNKILQSNIRQIQEYKSKLQSLLQQKDKQMTNSQEQYFRDLTQLQRLRIQDKNRYQSKILSIEEELISKKNLSDKYQRMLEQKSSQENSTNLKQENSLLEQIQSLRHSKYELSQQVQSLEQKNKQEIEKYYELQRAIRSEYENRISILESQLTKLRQKLTEQKKQLFQQNLESIENIQEKYKKLQNINELQQFQIKEKSEEVQKLAKNKIEKQKQINEVNQKLAEFKEKYDNLTMDYASLETLYDEIKEKYKTGVENMKGQIETMTRKIGQQRKNAQKRRMQGTKAEEELRQQLKLSKQHIAQLQEKLDEYKSLREQRKEDHEKVQKISQQVGTLVKQNQSLQTLTKSQSKALKQAQHNNKMHEQQKSKLLEYIQQLQQNISILSTKLAISSNKEISHVSIINKLDKQLKNLKLEYSACLEEMNLVLQKCKQLEEVSRESINHMEIIRQKYEMLNLQYMDLSDEKNKHCEELYGAYDQVNKLNMVLMTKQQQLVKLKNITNHAEKNKQFITQTIHHYMPSPITTISHAPMIPMSQSMPTSFNTMQVQYVPNNLSPILSPNSDMNTNMEENRNILRTGIRYDEQKNNVYVSQKSSNFRADENRDNNYGYASKSKNVQDLPNVKRVAL